MCVLLVSDYSDALDDARISQISGQIEELVFAARMAYRPIAFLHRKSGSGFGPFGVRIGRYDPVFTMSDCGAMISDGLAEFIVRHSVKPIQLAGVATARQFSRLSEIFKRAGLTTQMARRSILLLEDAAPMGRPLCDGAVQLSEYGPFICEETACAASRKNQSTRWPRA